MGIVLVRRQRKERRQFAALQMRAAMRAEAAPQPVRVKVEPVRVKVEPSSNQRQDIKKRRSKAQEVPAQALQELPARKKFRQLKMAPIKNGERVKMELDM
jgi:hypothetical protein